jgi:hypothetical protein
MYPIRTRKAPRMLPTTTNIPANEVKPTPGLEPGTPFITSFGQLSSWVIRSHLRSLRAPNPLDRK